MENNKWVARAILPVGLIGLATWWYAPDLLCKPKDVVDGMVVGCFEFWLNRYQTLISGIFALAAAFFVWVQISDDREATNRRRRVAKAALPQALSGLSDYTSRATDYLYGRISDIPLPSDQAILDVRAAIEFLDGAPAERAAEILNKMQIFDARIRGHVVGSGVGRQDRMYDCAVLQAYINSMFEYSRGMSDSVDLWVETNKNIVNALKKLDGDLGVKIDRNDFDDIRKSIDRRHPIIE